MRGSAVARAKIGIEDFEMMGIIGEGAYGKVFCAKDIVNNKKYAVKVLDKYHIMKVKLCLFMFIIESEG